MGVASENRDFETVRHALRRETSAAHEELDRSLGSLNLTTTSQYATFLSVQYAARYPIEIWAVRHCPSALRPPPQTGLIASDLAALGRPMPVLRDADTFDAPADGAAGLAWTLAGSAMGNRLLLKRVRAGKPGMPAAFLADDAMATFLAAIRPALERPAGSEPTLVSAIAAARAVFAYFASTTARMVPPVEKAA